MVIVSNAGPILSFVRAGRLDLLRQVTKHLIIPDAVHQEVFGPRRPDLPEELPWITRQTLRGPTRAEQLPNRLHRGEREAIILAQELRAALLIDDGAARREARRLGLPHLGSLRVLAEAKTRGLIPRVKPILDELIGAGTYISEPLYQQFLQELAEV